MNMESLQALSSNGLEQAKECLSLLKYSEGLVKRDIDLTRSQLEMKLKRLEDRAHAELKDIVENESFKVEEVIAEINETMKCARGDVRSTSLSDSRQQIIQQIDQLEKIRIRFAPNMDIENYIDKVNSIGTMSILRLKAEGVATVLEPNENNSVSNENKTESETFNKDMDRKGVSVSGLPLRNSSNENSSISSLEDERHAPEGEMADVTNTCSRNVSGNVELEVRVPNKDIAVHIEPSKSCSNNLNTEVPLTPTASSTNRIGESYACTHNTEVKDCKEAESMASFDPLSLLRSMKNFENEMKQYPLPPEFKQEDGNTNISWSSLPRGFRARSTTHENVPVGNSIRRANTISTGQDTHERGRDQTKSRIPVIRSRSTSPGTSIRDHKHAEDGASQQHDRSGFVPDPRARVLLANEMWFGPNVPDAHTRTRSASFGTKHSNPRAHIRRKQDDIQQSKHSKTESHHHGNHAKTKSYTTHSDPVEVRRCDDVALSHQTHVHSEAMVLYKHEHPVPKQDHHLHHHPHNHNQQQASRNALSVRDKRSRNRSIPSDITEDLKEARKQEFSGVKSNNINRSHNSSDQHIAQHTVDVKREVETQPVNIPIYISQPNDFNVAVHEIEQEKSALGPSFDSEVDNTLLRTEEIIRNPSRDRRRRNRTIAGDIKGLLKQARSLDNETHGESKCPKQEEKENFNSGETASTESTGLGKRETRRCKTITDDISEVLKAARVFASESNNQTPPTNPDMDSNASIIVPDTKVAPHLVADDSISPARRVFSRRRRLHKDDDDRHGNESSSSESDGPGYMKADRITGRLQIPAPNRLRIPSFDEMLYNQNNNLKK